MNHEKVCVRIPRRHPLRNRTPNEFIEELKRVLSGRVLEAYTFGSINTACFNQDSDVDLILVVDTNAPFVERAKQFSDVYDLAREMDILVYTPEELRALLGENVGFWKSVKETMVRII